MVLMAVLMIEAYSLDLRKRAVALLDEGASSPEVAEMLGVSDSWVRKMRLRLERLGHLMPGSPPGRERKLTIDDVVVLGELCAEDPDATLDELAERMSKRQRVRVSISTLSRRLIELGLTRKKRVSTPARPIDPRSSENASGSCGAPSSEARPGCSSSTRPASTCR
jgi:transposase